MLIGFPFVPKKVFMRRNCVLDAVRSLLGVHPRLLGGLRSGRSDHGCEFRDRPVHAKPRARERPGLLVLLRGFSTSYGG